jgi:DNA helicase IV
VTSTAPPPDLAGERAALERARAAVEAKITRLVETPRTQAGVVFAEYTDPFIQEGIDSVLQGTIETLQRDLVVFGRIDDDRPWRVGLYGVDDLGDQLVIDWRARFAEKYYRATFDEPLDLTRRVSYVGCIDDLFVEDFASGEVAGTSPLLAELSKRRGSTMRAAVATLQSEQDRLVRLDPRARLVLRGGPGTGKTVVGLHRAAWLVYNDRRVTSDQILVLGPSERYLRFVATVLPTLGEAKVKQTTFATLLGPSREAGSDERWLQILDDLERSLVRPAAITLGRRTVDEDDVAALVDRYLDRPLPWRDRRVPFVNEMFKRFDDPAARVPVTRREVTEAVKAIWPPLSVKQVETKLRSMQTLTKLGVERELRDAWLATDGDGALRDEVRARVEGVPARYSHVIVDEAQDLSLLQLRAVLRRADGLTLVGDDAQRSNPSGIGLVRAAELVAAPLEEMRTAYRMSAEIAAWLNAHARAHALPAVELVGIRPTGTDVGTAPSITSAARALRDRWDNVAVIAAGEVWDHKGVEYDAVAVDTSGMTPSEVYLAASRAAHELVVF